MKSLKEMSLDEFVRHVTMLAHGFAAESFKYRNPVVSEDDAWRHAARSWKAHVDQVLDFLAVSEAMDGADPPERN